MMRGLPDDLRNDGRRWMRTLAAQTIGCITSLCLFSGCGASDTEVPRDKASQPRLVLLYMPCTVNKSYLSPYNPELTLTPNLDAFQKTATLF